jgi:hypothetical protein
MQLHASSICKTIRLHNWKVNFLIKKAKYEESITVRLKKGTKEKLDSIDGYDSASDAVRSIVETFTSDGEGVNYNAQ